MTCNSRPRTWLIACLVANGSDLSALYWSNALGWTSIEEADLFPDVERKLVSLPMGGHWVAADPKH